MSGTSIFGVTYVGRVDRPVCPNRRRLWHGTVSLEFPFHFSAAVERVNVTLNLPALVQTSTEHFRRGCRAFWKVNVTIGTGVDCAVSVNRRAGHGNISSLDLPSNVPVVLDRVEVPIPVRIMRTHINDAIVSNRGC